MYDWSQYFGEYVDEEEYLAQHGRLALRDQLIRDLRYLWQSDHTDPQDRMTDGDVIEVAEYFERLLERQHETGETENA